VGTTTWEHLLPYQPDLTAVMADLPQWAGAGRRTHAVTEKEARVTFGTTAPTLHDLERWGGTGAPEVRSLLPDTGDGRHLVLYHDDRPAHVLFWGPAAD
jgi:hypothetical protein